jgi:hypothetical protein
MGRWQASEDFASSATEARGAHIPTIWLENWLSFVTLPPVFEFRFSDTAIVAAILVSFLSMANGGEPHGHWAYAQPKRPMVSGSQVDGRNDIDAFVYSRLASELPELSPSPEADRPTLIRRLSLDLTGLPPSPAEVDVFAVDNSLDAYDRLVERLLASERFGEKWGQRWLDMARYADSNGFQRDGFRVVWPYRDWVVRALNEDKPFDEFVVEQLAGDLLENATQDQMIATGFHRGPTVNVEAGTDQEANRVNAVFDRVNTTGVVFLGMSLECAQCHDHKYDPVSTKEYYQLFAYFNQTEIETKRRNRVDLNSAALDFTGPYEYLPAERKLEDRHSALKKKLASAIGNLERLRFGEGLADKERIKKMGEYQKEISGIEKELEALPIPKSLVMREAMAARPTRILKRGILQDGGDVVQPGVPSVLHGLEDGHRSDRLGLARWIASRSNPLLARVTVNRWWAELFGRGLVDSLEEFGSKGERPSHPELLDWLAVEFMESGWSMKHIIRLTVTSATYRQSSKYRPGDLRLDPDNRYYARGPRARLSAEAIRDNALSIAGLLDKKMGGPPVMPPQPPNIWRVTGEVDNTYRTSTGGDRYRRGLYTIWRRSAPYPSFQNFDAPPRDACVVQRSQSNTPCAALTLMNDPVHVEAAAALAVRMQLEGADGGVIDQLCHGFRICTGRWPNDEERPAIEKHWKRLHEEPRMTSEECAELVKSFHGHVVPGQSVELQAAWWQMASLFFNLSETITKP